MRIFLAGIIQGSLVDADIHDQNWREPIKRLIARSLPDADVYCHFSHHPTSIRYDLPDIRKTLTEGITEAAASDLVVAYVPTASMGTALEIYEAARAGATVVTISPLKANWVIRAYSDCILDSVDAFETFLASGRLEALMKPTK